MDDYILTGVDSEALAKQCVEICEDRKAENLQLYDVRSSSMLADFYLICTGRSAPHLRAISGKLRKDLAEAGIRPRGVEGDPQSQWIVLDYGLVLVHVMDAERRAYYRMEELWQEASLVYRGGGESEDFEPEPVTFEL